MRSSIYGAAIAAIVFSFPFAGAAFARDQSVRAGQHDFMSPPMYNGDHQPPEPAYQVNGQLDDLKVIVSDLNARITADAQSGKIRPREARTLHADSAGILHRATADNRAGGGMIPTGQYRALLAQLNALRAQT